MFGLCRSHHSASTKLGAGYIGWLELSPVRDCRSLTTTTTCTVDTSAACCDMAGTSSGQDPSHGWPTVRWMSHCCLTTQPILCNFTQFDNLQVVVIQFKVVGAFEEIAVICRTHKKMVREYGISSLP